MGFFSRSECKLYTIIVFSERKEINTVIGFVKTLFMPFCFAIQYFVRFWQVFRRIVEIPVETNCASSIANFFVYFYESYF